MASVLILDKVLPVSFLSSILDNNIRRHPRGSDVQIRQKITANKNSGKWKGMGINHQRQAPTSERLFVIPPVKQSEAEYNAHSQIIREPVFQGENNPILEFQGHRGSAIKQLQNDCARAEKVACSWSIPTAVTRVPVPRVQCKKQFQKVRKVPNQSTSSWCNRSIRDTRVPEEPEAQ